MAPAEVAEEANGEIRFVEWCVPRVVMCDRRDARQHVLQRTMPESHVSRDSNRCLDLVVAAIGLERVDPRVAVRKRLRVSQTGNVVQLQMIVRIDQTWKDQV